MTLLLLLVVILPFIEIPPLIYLYLFIKQDEVVYAKVPTSKGENHQHTQADTPFEEKMIRTRFYFISYLYRKFCPMKIENGEKYV